MPRPLHLSFFEIILFDPDTEQWLGHETLIDVNRRWLFSLRSETSSIIRPFFASLSWKPVGYIHVSEKDDPEKKGWWPLLWLLVAFLLLYSLAYPSSHFSSLSPSFPSCLFCPFSYPSALKGLHPSAWNMPKLQDQNPDTNPWTGCPALTGRHLVLCSFSAGARERMQESQRRHWIDQNDITSCQASSLGPRAGASQQNTWIMRSTQINCIQLL